MSPKGIPHWEEVVTLSADKFSITDYVFLIKEND
jgi:hypothetical protein